jgi:hypothetical protein
MRSTACSRVSSTRVGPDLLRRAHREVAQQWFLHLVTGAMTGVPYKLHAVEAGAIAINPWLFVPASFAARFSRFFLTVVAMAAARAVLSMMNRARWAFAARSVARLLVYGTYFTIRAQSRNLRRSAHDNPIPRRLDLPRTISNAGAMPCMLEWE